MTEIVTPPLSEPPIASSSKPLDASKVRSDAQETPTVQTSLEEVWYLKTIAFQYHFVRVITQNYNGPCSLIAICNILILRGKIEILPPSRQTVSYELLSQLVGEYLLVNCPEIDISAALSILPYTQKGMDLNPLFTGAKSFRPGGDGGELKLFEHVGIELVHGWLVDPDSPEAAVLAKYEDYDNAMTLIAGADHISNGQLVQDESSEPQAGSSSSTNKTWTDEERTKMEDAIIVRQFLDNTRSQLTYHGLFHLSETAPRGTLLALYRNLHLSVLYKPPGDDPSIYSLVTDQVFLHESSVVWERLEDVDGGWSTFVDADFVKSSPAGGEFAGRTAEDIVRAAEWEANQFIASEPGDLALAEQLQAEEHNRARYERTRRQDEYERRIQENKRRKEEKAERKRQKKGGDCLIM